MDSCKMRFVLYRSGKILVYKRCMKLIVPVTEAAELVASFGEEDISNNALGIELASMRHEYLFSRLFIS